MTSTHWTERSFKDYWYKLAADFVRQIEAFMDVNEMTQVQLARDLGISTGRVSQILNNPGNLTLKNIVKFSRILGLKVSIVTYSDDDPKNQRGPIPASIFEACWSRAGKPCDFFQLRQWGRPTENAVSRATLVPIANGGFFIVDEEWTQNVEIAEASKPNIEAVSVRSLHTGGRNNARSNANLIFS